MRRAACRVAAKRLQGGSAKILASAAIDGLDVTEAISRRPSDSAKKEAMADVLMSLVPVFALIGLGVLLRRFTVLSAEGWGALERLTYFVLFPPLMFMSIVEGSFAGEDALWLGVAL